MVNYTTISFLEKYAKSVRRIIDLRESKLKKQERAEEIVTRLRALYPDSKCSLNYKSAHELLVATILSAQCTDHRVNIVTKDLFQKYRTPTDFAYCSVMDLAL